MHKLCQWRAPTPAAKGRCARERMGPTVTLEPLPMQP